MHVVCVLCACCVRVLCVLFVLCACCFRVVCVGLRLISAWFSIVRVTSTGSTTAIGLPTHPSDSDCLGERSSEHAAVVKFYILTFKS